ncbi:hypothetical protein ACFL2I_03320 [Candidatus Omnitrophota bacterium]
MRLKRTNIYNYFIINKPNSLIISSQGQVILSYVLIIAVIVAAMVSIQLYIQRGLQGRYKSATDYALNAIGAAQGLDNPAQYDPYYERTIYDTRRDSQVTLDYLDGQSTTTIESDSTTTGASVIPPYME